MTENVQKDGTPFSCKLAGFMTEEAHSLILKYQLFSPLNLYCIKLGGRDGWYFSVDLILINFDKLI